MGYWGAVTSTFDWCESNYTVSPWVAEWWNAWSSLVIAYIGWMGLRSARRLQMEWRFQFCQYALMLVGFGSFAFHGTLTYTSQLADELPMVYGGATLVYATLLLTAKAGEQHRLLASALSIYVIFFTIVYTAFYRNPVFHHNCYGVLAAICVVQGMRRAMSGKQEPLQRRMYLMAASMYVGGFVLWIIDREHCDALRSVREQLPRLLQPLLELHSWWHIGSGLGTYYYAVAMHVERLRFLGKAVHVTWHAVIFPDLAATKEKK